MKFNRNKDLINKFNQLSLLINLKFKSQKEILVEEFMTYMEKIFDKKWLKNIYDILYLYQTMEYIQIKLDKKDNIISFEKNKTQKNIPIFENFNDEIIYYFQTGPILSDFNNFLSEKNKK